MQNGTAQVALPHDEPSPTDAFKEVISYCTSKGLPLIVGSNANAHHIVWGTDDVRLVWRLSGRLARPTGKVTGLVNDPAGKTFVQMFPA